MTYYLRLNEALEKYQKEKKDFSIEIKAFVQDEKQELDQRWNTFINAGRLGLVPHDRWYHKPDGVDWDKRSLYDDFNIDKYVSTDVERMLDMAIDNDIFQEDSKEERKFKEYFMKKFVYSFTNDW